jgi:hypothetical protein
MTFTHYYRKILPNRKTLLDHDGPNVPRRNIARRGTMALGLACLKG